MKRHILLSGACLAICLSGFAATADFPINPKPWEILSEDLKVITYNRLSEKDLQEIMEGKHPQVAVEFTAQSILPINLYLSGDLVYLVESHQKWGTIEIKQTFYARCVDKELILSSNLTDWKSVLEFITGNATVALTIQDGQASILVGSETNRRS